MTAICHNLLLQIVMVQKRTTRLQECNTALLDLILSGLIGFKLLKADAKTQGKQLLHEVYGDRKGKYGQIGERAGPPTILEEMLI